MRSNTHTCSLRVMTNEKSTPPVGLLLQRAVALVGSQAKLGKASGFSQHAIWLAIQSGRVSAELAVGIERATGGAVRRSDLRPDLFGTPESESA